ncbi:hypothetical protein [Mycobacterium sp. 852002-51961_SCH5331710]|uniref:hypothetical protein n=1 Tax=Mycobacterium sp. 852002-51961_SCH5331710 TaxID=1834105 RepID=UPI0008010127|nr:hypothetical protein [Mycobacterium sp. 852002-51961_SCH5331710]OBB34994.1 hypothetical protein A5752_20745 [Mycobacterium sp. 852002-51961_SCH5331710]
MATLRRQCWLFAIGSAFFAIATAPGVSALAGAGLSNLLCFIGSWFFTTAGWMQLVLARPVLGVGWLSAATQSAGTVLFNISTGAALWAHAVEPERRLVWAPDAIGSTAFLISGVLGVVAVTVAVGVAELKSRDWQAEWINLVGCLAFGVSAAGAYVSGSGVTEDAKLANVGTFVGALCFLAAALLVLPRERPSASSAPGS